MATSIKYNGKDLPKPLPLISRDETTIRYGDKWGTQYIYTLQGSIVNCTGYDALIDEQSKILDIFNKDFQSFSITDTDVNINYPVCFIENIDFGSSDYLYNIPYTITISTYATGFFEEIGILNPQDNWKFQETEDKKVQLSHTVGARGFNTTTTDTNGLRNAINFVQQRTGLMNEPSLQFITGQGDFILETQNESLNRLNAEYSIIETYSKDQLASGIVKRYLVDLSSGLEGFVNVGVNGTVEGGINADLTDVRNDYHAFDIFSIVSGFYESCTTNTDLNIWPIGSGIIEDPFRKTISFDISYDNNPNPLVNLIYNTSVTEGDTTTNINVDGEIVGRGDVTNRWSEVQDYYFNNFSGAYQLAVNGYSWYGGTYSVNTKPVTSGIVFDSHRGAISFRATFNDKINPPANFKDFNYVLSFKPSIRQVRSTPLFTTPFGNTGDYYFTDLGYYNKMEFNINGSAILENILTTDLSTNLVIEEVDKIFFTYSNQGAIQTQRDITFKPPFGQEVNFNFSWVMDGPTVNNTENYELIINLGAKI